MLDLFTCQSPYQTNREDVKREQIDGFIDEVAGTDVDAIMVCPTAWRLPLYPSRVDPRWTPASDLRPLDEPGVECDVKYFERVYYRVRRYMQKGEDPLALTLAAARRNGFGAFISYRMNDHHYLQYESSPTHSSVWRDHWQWRLPHPGQAEPVEHQAHILNYLVPEVRAWYFAILRELAETYDIDGIEFDFMRSPQFFPADRIAEGTQLMTAFVRDVRNLLDDLGRRRGRRLLLGCRVPWALEGCAAIGLDVKGWDAAKLVDMVNISLFYKTTCEIRVDEFVRDIRHATTYGELNFVTTSGKTPYGYTNNINRRTTVEQYRALAFSFLTQGVQGISLFNFMYTRDHSFGDPRRIYPGEEPPFAALRGITDRAFLAAQAKHYVFPPSISYLGLDRIRGFRNLPMPLSGRQTREFTFFVADTPADGHFSAAVLKVELDKPEVEFKLVVRLNGTELTPFHGQGELFEPFSKEGLVGLDYMKHYRVPLACLRQGENTLAFAKASVGEYGKSGFTITMVELALYVPERVAAARREPLQRVNGPRRHARRGGRNGRE
jgi:hypothetical protein